MHSVSVTPIYQLCEQSVSSFCFLSFFLIIFSFCFYFCFFCVFFLGGGGGSGVKGKRGVDLI